MDTKTIVTAAAILLVLGAGYALAEPAQGSFWNNMMGDFANGKGMMSGYGNGMMGNSGMMAGTGNGMGNRGMMTDYANGIMGNASAMADHMNAMMGNVSEMSDYMKEMMGNTGTNGYRNHCGAYGADVNNPQIPG